MTQLSVVPVALEGWASGSERVCTFDVSTHYIVAGDADGDVLLYDRRCLGLTGRFGYRESIPAGDLQSGGATVEHVVLSPDEASLGVVYSTRSGPVVVAVHVGSLSPLHSHTRHGTHVTCAAWAPCSGALYTADVGGQVVSLSVAAAKADVQLIVVEEGSIVQMSVSGSGPEGGHPLLVISSLRRTVCWPISVPPSPERVEVQPMGKQPREGVHGACASQSLVFASRPRKDFDCRLWKADPASGGVMKTLMFRHTPETDSDTVVVSGVLGASADELNGVYEKVGEREGRSKYKRRGGGGTLFSTGGVWAATDSLKARLLLKSAAHEGTLSVSEVGGWEEMCPERGVWRATSKVGVHDEAYYRDLSLGLGGRSESVHKIAPVPYIVPLSEPACLLAAWGEDAVLVLNTQSIDVEAIRYVKGLMRVVPATISDVPVLYALHCAEGNPSRLADPSRRVFVSLLWLTQKSEAAPVPPQIPPPAAAPATPGSAGAGRPAVSDLSIPLVVPGVSVDASSPPATPGGAVAELPHNDSTGALRSEASSSKDEERAAAAPSPVEEETMMQLTLPGEEAPLEVVRTPRTQQAAAGGASAAAAGADSEKKRKKTKVVRRRKKEGGGDLRASTATSEGAASAGGDGGGKGGKSVEELLRSDEPLCFAKFQPKLVELPPPETFPLKPKEEGAEGGEEDGGEEGEKEKEKEREEEQKEPPFTPVFVDPAVQELCTVPPPQAPPVAESSSGVVAPPPEAEGEAAEPSAAAEPAEAEPAAAEASPATEEQAAASSSEVVDAAADADAAAPAPAEEEQAEAEVEAGAAAPDAADTVAASSAPEENSVEAAEEAPPAPLPEATAHQAEAEAEAEAEAAAPSSQQEEKEAEPAVAAEVPAAAAAAPTPLENAAAAAAEDPPTPPMVPDAPPTPGDAEVEAEVAVAARATPTPPPPASRSRGGSSSPSVTGLHVRSNIKKGVEKLMGRSGSRQEMCPEDAVEVDETIDGWGVVSPPTMTEAEMASFVTHTDTAHVALRDYELQVSFSSAATDLCPQLSVLTAVSEWVEHLLPVIHTDLLLDTALPSHSYDTGRSVTLMSQTTRSSLRDKVAALLSMHFKLSSNSVLLQRCSELYPDRASLRISEGSVMVRLLHFMDKRRLLPAMRASLTDLTVQCATIGAATENYIALTYLLNLLLPSPRLPLPRGYLTHPASCQYSELVAGMWQPLSSEDEAALKAKSGCVDQLVLSRDLKSIEAIAALQKDGLGSAALIYYLPYLYAGGVDHAMKAQNLAVKSYPAVSWPVVRAASSRSVQEQTHTLLGLQWAGTHEYQEMFVDYCRHLAEEHPDITKKESFVNQYILVLVHTIMRVGALSPSDSPRTLTCVGGPTSNLGATMSALNSTSAGLGSTVGGLGRTLGATMGGMDRTVMGRAPSRNELMHDKYRRRLEGLFRTILEDTTTYTYSCSEVRAICLKKKFYPGLLVLGECHPQLAAACYRHCLENGQNDLLIEHFEAVKENEREWASLMQSGCALQKEERTSSSQSIGGPVGLERPQEMCSMERVAHLMCASLGARRTSELLRKHLGHEVEYEAYYKKMQKLVSMTASR